HTVFLKTEKVADPAGSGSLPTGPDPARVRGRPLSGIPQDTRLPALTRVCHCQKRQARPEAAAGEGQSDPVPTRAHAAVPQGVSRGSSTRRKDTLIWAHHRRVANRRPWSINSPIQSRTVITATGAVWIAGTSSFGPSSTIDQRPRFAKRSVLNRTTTVDI